MFWFPDKLITRMNQTIPARERSKLVAQLLEKEISRREENLYLAAREQKLFEAATELEQCEELNEEISLLIHEFGGDGLGDV